MTTTELIQAEQILTDWLEHEGDSHPSDPKLPLHPEFHYRKSGEWISWNHFLSTPTDTDAYRENEARDPLETLAWNLYTQRH